VARRSMHVCFWVYSPISACALRTDRCLRSVRRSVAWACAPISTLSLHTIKCLKVCAQIGGLGLRTIECLKVCAP
jgi:hypothetical protein